MNSFLDLEKSPLCGGGLGGKKKKKKRRHRTIFTSYQLEVTRVQDYLHFLPNRGNEGTGISSYPTN